MEWHGRLRELFLTAYPNRQHEQDFDLMQAFALGLLDTKAREYVLDMIGDGANFTYAQTLAAAQSKIATGAVISGKEKRGGAVSSMGYTNRNDEDTGNRQDRLCWLCKSPNHLKRDCPMLKAARLVANERQGPSHSGRVGKSRPPRGGGANYRGNFRGRGSTRGGGRGGYNGAQHGGYNWKWNSHARGSVNHMARGSGQESEQNVATSQTAEAAAAMEAAEQPEEDEYGTYDPRESALAEQVASIAAEAAQAYLQSQAGN